MNHNTLVSRLPVAALAGTLAATALAGCERQAESSTPKPWATSEVSAPSTVRQLNAAKSAGTILFAASTTPGGPHDIYKKDLHTGKVTNLTDTPNADELNPQVSPDRKKAVYAGNDNPDGNYQIYQVSLATGKVVRLTNRQANDFDPAYRPNGNILYKSNADDGYGDIWEMTGDGQNRHNLTPGMAGTEEWKPTAVGNNLIVFTSRHADDGTMTRRQLAATDDLMLIDTSRPDLGVQPLTRRSGPDWYSEAKPDDPNIIAYTSKATPGGPDAIYKMDITQPDPEAHRIQLTNPDELPGDSSDCSWAGNTLLLANNGTGTYRALARTPYGTYYQIAGGMAGGILSPVAAGPITVG